MTYAIKGTALDSSSTLRVSSANNTSDNTARRNVRNQRTPTPPNDRQHTPRSEFLDKNEAQLRDYYRRRAEYERMLRDRSRHTDTEKPQKAAYQFDQKYTQRSVSEAKRTPASNYRLDGAYISHERRSHTHTPAQDYTVIGRLVPSNRKLRQGVHVDEAQREYERKRKDYINLKLYRERKKEYELSRERARKSYYEAVRRAIIDEHRTAAEIEIKARASEARKAKLKAISHRLKAPMIVMLTLLVLIGGAVGIYKNVFVIDSMTFDTGGLYSEDALLDASGIKLGDNLYSFSSAAVSRTLILRYPQISAIAVQRKAPSTIVFTAKTEANAFYAEIYGETYYISKTLRLLGKVSRKDAEASGAINLKLPKISTAIAGEEISFDESRSANIAKLMLEAVLQSELSDRIGSIDLRDAYDITLVCDDLYRLKLGSVSDVSLKLRIAAAVLRDEMFNGANKATLDLSSTDETGVIIDNQLDLTY